MKNLENNCTSSKGPLSKQAALEESKTLIIIYIYIYIYIYSQKLCLLIVAFLLGGGSVFDWVDSLIGPDGLLLVVCPDLTCLPNLFCSLSSSFMGGVGKKEVK